jgi:hypothetical protein
MLQRRFSGKHCGEPREEACISNFAMQLNIFFYPSNVVFGYSA